MYCNVPVNVSVLGQSPANRLDIPKSDILTTPLYVLTNTLSPKQFKFTFIFKMIKAINLLGDYSFLVPT